MNYWVIRKNFWTLNLGCICMLCVMTMIVLLELSNQQLTFMLTSYTVHKLTSSLSMMNVREWLQLISDKQSVASYLRTQIISWGNMLISGSHRSSAAASRFIIVAIHMTIWLTAGGNRWLFSDRWRFTDRWRLLSSWRPTIWRVFRRSCIRLLFCAGGMFC